MTASASLAGAGRKVAAAKVPRQKPIWLATALLVDNDSQKHMERLGRCKPVLDEIFAFESHARSFFASVFLILVDPNQRAMPVKVVSRKTVTLISPGYISSRSNACAISWQTTAACSSLVDALSIMTRSSRPALIA